MKILLLLCFFILLSFQSSFSRTIEVDVHGMTCSFCVNALEKKFKQESYVTKVEVSLKLKKLRITSESDTMPSLEDVKQGVLDSGFTPMKINVLKE